MRLIDADALIEQIAKNKCEPCKIHGHDRKGLRCRFCQYGDEMDDIYDAPTIEPQKWIPCSERLPEKFRRVLCTIQDGEQLYVSLGAFIRHTDAPGNPDFRVVAWMPLPEEPYKEEE